MNLKVVYILLIIIFLIITIFSATIITLIYIKDCRVIKNEENELNGQIKDLLIDKLELPKNINIKEIRFSSIFPDGYNLKVIYINEFTDKKEIMNYSTLNNDSKKEIYDYFVDKGKYIISLKILITLISISMIAIIILLILLKNKI